jgi:hypothetical protein
MADEEQVSGPKMYENSDLFRRDVEELYGVFFNRDYVSKSARDPYELFTEVREKLVESINRFSSGASTESHNFLLLQLMVLLDRTDARDPQGVSEAVQSLWANQERMVDRINSLSSKPEQSMPQSKSVLEKFNISGVPTPEQFERLVGKGVDFLKRGLQPLQERGVLKQVLKIIQESVVRAQEGGHLTRGTMETALLLVHFCQKLRGSHAECTSMLKERIFADIDDIFLEIKEVNERIHGHPHASPVDIKPLGSDHEPIPDLELAGVTAFFDKKVIERAPSMQSIPTLIDEMLTLLELYLAKDLTVPEQGKLIVQLQAQARSFDVVVQVAEMSFSEVLPATVKLVAMLRALPRSKASWDLEKIRAEVAPLCPLIRKNYVEFFGGGAK